VDLGLVRQLQRRRTTAKLILERAVGTWLFTLTIADGRGGTGTDRVTSVLHK
jgi:hypothetical protein